MSRPYSSWCHVCNTAPCSCRATMSTKRLIEILLSGNHAQVDVDEAVARWKAAEREFTSRKARTCETCAEKHEAMSASKLDQIVCCRTDRMEYRTFSCAAHSPKEPE